MVEMGRKCYTLGWCGCNCLFMEVEFCTSIGPVCAHVDRICTILLASDIYRGVGNCLDTKLDIRTDDALFAVENLRGIKKLC